MTIKSEGFVSKFWYRYVWSRLVNFFTSLDLSFVYFKIPTVCPR